MKIIRKLFAIIFIVSAASACTGLPVNEAVVQLEIKPICCSAFSELTFGKLPSSTRHKVALDSSSPVMEFPEGRSFVVAFSLPSAASFLSVQSIYPEYLPKTSYVDPVIIVLDANKKEIGRYASLNLQHERHVIFPGLWEWYFGSRVSLPENASYVVIYADNKSKRILRAISEGGVSWPVPPVPIGTLALSVQ